MESTGILNDGWSKYDPESHIYRCIAIIFDTSVLSKDHSANPISTFPFTPTSCIANETK